MDHGLGRYLIGREADAKAVLQVGETDEQDQVRASEAPGFHGLGWVARGRRRGRNIDHGVLAGVRQVVLEQILRDLFVGRMYVAPRHGKYGNPFGGEQSRRDRRGGEEEESGDEIETHAASTSKAQANDFHRN